MEIQKRVSILWEGKFSRLLVAVEIFHFLWNEQIGRAIDLTEEDR